MAIIEYTPKKSKEKDNRSEDGGYYTAKCDVCGTVFYPKNRSAKYCSTNCLVTAYRRRRKAKESKIKPPKKA